MKIFERFLKKKVRKTGEIEGSEFQSIRKNEMDELRLLKERILNERLKEVQGTTTTTTPPSLEKPPIVHKPFSIPEIQEEKFEHLKKEGESGKEELALERIDARLETILAKLEAINERLRVIEEKLERRY